MIEQGCTPVNTAWIYWKGFKPKPRMYWVDNLDCFSVQNRKQRPSPGQLVGRTGFSSRERTVLSRGKCDSVATSRRTLEQNAQNSFALSIHSGECDSLTVLDLFSQKLDDESFYCVILNIQGVAFVYFQRSDDGKTTLSDLPDDCLRHILARLADHRDLVHTGQSQSASARSMW